LQLRIVRNAAVAAAFLVSGYGAALAQTTPSASPPPRTGRSSVQTGGAPAQTALATPAGRDAIGITGLTLSGVLRAYDFDRLNTPEYNGKGAASGPNRAAFNFGGDLRADYKIGDTPFSVGGAFWGAYPFGLNGGSIGCNVGGTLVVNEPQAVCAKNNAGIDNSLPGYSLETFEYYVKYTEPSAAITIGNQLLNKAWMPASDSRIKPALYQGGDGTINLSRTLSLGLTRITRFEDRTESTFDQCTLLTCTMTPAGVGSGGEFKSTTPITTGADRVNLNFKPTSHTTVATEQYFFQNIANLTYVEAKSFYVPQSSANPFFGFQFVNENQTGTAILGKVENQTIGAQLGTNVAKNVVFTLGADYAPWNYDNVYASSASAAEAKYFQPGGGTNTVVEANDTNGTATNAVELSPGLYRVAYGGIASPYSDSYTSDPLYTTSISQGMVDRRSAGTTLKGTLAYTGMRKRLLFLASEGIYDYDTSFARNRTYEFDADLTFNFSAARPGAYHGFSIRERFADRTQPTLPFNFIYLRHQIQYSF
jgi:hypothetical protein